MFALIESCPESRPGFGWTGKVISLAIHAFVISLAVAVTDSVASRIPRTQIEDHHIVWEVSPVASTLHEVASAHQLTLPKVLLTLPKVLLIPNTVPMYDPQVPQPFVGIPLDRDRFTPAGTPPGPVTGSGTGTASNIGGAPFDERLVEERPELLSHPQVRYPDVLRQAGIEGQVMVETVLDTLGRAEQGRTRVVSSAHALFDAEAISVVLGSRYRPARVAGRAVRVRVQVPVNFQIR